MSGSDAPLLASESNQPTDADDTQGQAAGDTQPTPEPQPKEGDATPADDDTKVDDPKPSEPEPKKDEPEGEPKEGEGDDADDAEPGAPEQYDEFDAPEGAPEGFKFGKEVTDAIETVARELNLPQDRAQAVVDQLWSAQFRQEADTHAAWKAEVEQDKEIGGDKLPENLATARRAIDVYGGESEALEKLLASPFGSHPEVVRFLVAVGKDVSEDQFVGGKKGKESVDPTDMAAVAKAMYPDAN